MKGGKSMKTDFNLLRSVGSRAGFTLLEVLIVVVIAVLVTMFAVPSYRKAQERNRFMAATGVLMDIGNAARMLHEDYPNLTYNANVTANTSWTDSNCPSEPTSSNALMFLQCHRYLNDIPFSGTTYQGYSYKISAKATASCSGCSASGVACMYDTDALSEYKCAYIDKSGILHNN